ncbi:unnamed protein product [Discosporangium mesarthrocarpum]
MKRVALGVVARTLEASEMNVLEEEFHKADVGHRGVISMEDFRSVLQESHKFDPAEVDDIFIGVDLAKSGKISYTEFIAAALNRQGPLRQLDERRLKYAFERMDYDNDGEVDYEDLVMIVGSDMSNDEVRQGIKHFDSSGNGRVTFR